MPELTELETRLTTLAVNIDWPPTPDMAAAVTRRITSRRRWYASRWALAAASVIVAAAALAAYTPTRTAIADWLNLHLNIQHVNPLPTPSPLPSGPLGSRLGLGDESTLQAARISVRWNLLVPASLGAPDEVYVQPASYAPAQGEITLVYSARAGIPVSGQTGVSVLITEARGTVDSVYFGKMVGLGTTVDPVTVKGNSGYWISGSLHDFFFTDVEGNQRSETMRLATNTLILDEGGTIVRIEGNLTKQQALEIAASLQ